MQKKALARESFVQKFPDSERGEMKQRASFLGGEVDDDVEDSSVRSFKNLQQMIQSPTKGDKTPFSKTPRAKMGADPEDSEDICSSPRELKGGQKDDKDVKKHRLGKLFLSKHRNKR